MALRVFVDFDGTITRQDVGNVFFRTFGGAACDALVCRYHEGTLSAPALFRAEAAAMGRVDRRSLAALVDAQEIDPSFPAFAAFCRARGVPVRILSDGLDYYIGRILAREGCADVPFTANRAALVPAGRDGTVEVALEFPNADAVCDRCACCKRNAMLGEAGENDRIVYVGEGYSDRCPARYADVVFARDHLQAYCQEENISYYPYTTFDDVRSRLAAILDGPPLRARARAERERRAAFRRES